MNSIKAIIIPGNGDASPEDIWYPYVKEKLEEIGIPTANGRFPDAYLARSEYWLPFIKKLGADENTILIGHSSGAVAAMRYAEENRILGSILVGTCYTDLNNDMEKQSGYYDKPWDYEAIRQNQSWILQFASLNDPFIPVNEARFIHEKLATKYFESKDQGHFSGSEFPEMMSAIKKLIEIPGQS